MNAKKFKILAFLLAAASMSVIYLRRHYKELKEEQRAHDELNEVRQQRTIVASRLNREKLISEGQESCIICLTHPRECVLLDCGHVCVCVDCFENLPTPRQCPVCRSPVVRTVALYFA